MSYQHGHGGFQEHPAATSTTSLSSISKHTTITPHYYLPEFKSRFLGPLGQLQAWPSSPEQETLLPLTYGIECETTLAFHQSAVRFYRKGNRTDQRIVKKLKPNDRKKLNNAQRTDRWSRMTRPDKYQSWAVLSDLDEPLFHNDHVRLYMHYIKLPMDQGTLERKRKKYPIDFNADDHLPILRTWWSEPLEIVEDLFERKRKKAKADDGPPEQHIRVKPNLRKQLRRYEDQPYQDWTVTNDQTLVSAPRQMLNAILRSQGFAQSEAECEEWDTSGIEIVSRVMQAGSPDGFAEIEWVMDTIANKSEPCITFQSVFTALQVHVGFDEVLFAGRKPLSEQMDPIGYRLEQQLAQPRNELMLILQHLSYILLSFEHIYTQLVPRHRRGLEGSLSAGDTRSNRAHFLKTLRELKGPNPCLVDVWSVIFDRHLEMQQLMEWMQCGRAFMVNFENITLAWENPETTTIRTVEFRFHEGTQDATQIKLFVMLCVAIVRAAGRMAKSDRLYNWETRRFGEGQRLESTQRGDFFAEASKYPLQNIDEDFEKPLKGICTLDIFFDLLQLDGMQRWYWKARYDYFSKVEMEQQYAWQERYPEVQEREQDLEEYQLMAESPGEDLGTPSPASSADREDPDVAGASADHEETEEELDRIEQELIREMEARG